MALFMIGAFAWGVHLASVGFNDVPDTENATSSVYNFARLLVVVSWAIAALFTLNF